MAETPQTSKQARRGSGGREISMELRLLLAFILMGVVLFLTPHLYKAPEPVKPAQAPATAGEQAPAPPAKPTPVPAAPPPAVAKPPTAKPVSAQKEETFILETDLYRIVFSNRGALVRSWILKKYTDSTGEPLELVNLKGVAKAGYPFALAFKEIKPPLDLNQALFAARPAPDLLGVDYEFSDGRVAARKSFRFRKDKYLCEVSTELAQVGVAVPHLLTWRGGFGDTTVQNAAATQHSLYFDLSAGKLVVEEAKVAKEGPVSRRGNYSFAGIEDSYFAAVALPRDGTSFEITTFSDQVPSSLDEKEQAHVGAGVGGDGRNQFSVYVGPKDIDLLRQIDPKLVQVVDFGWFGIIAKPLFLSLKWINDRWVHSYGWSIVLITVAINFLLLPLKLTSLKSMKKMQLLQPQVAAINERYKGISIRDPRKAQQNQEVMELYKKHGVNPLGGCMPMLLQIPFFIAFYKVLTVAIELRGADWLWVTDLSRPEHLPIRILPVAMIVSQFVMQKMTPATSPDPTQQRMMMLMPLILGFMFYGVSSGLVLYWLTSNLVGIAQQVLFNKTFYRQAPVTPVKPAAKKKGGRK